MEIGPRKQALSAFVQRLIVRSPLGNDEVSALLALPAHPQKVAAHRDFVRLGDDVDHACLIVDGLAARFAQLQDGSRQTISLHIPGDMADLYSLMLPKAPSTLHALTDTTIVKIPHEALRGLTAAYPAIANAFWRDCVVDGNIIAQWLVNVGRRNSRARLAHLLCEMAVRTGGADGPPASFPLRMTQEQLADALGLTSVHVNRTLKAMREEGLARLTRRELIIEDWHRLVQAGEFDPSYLALPETASSSRKRVGT